MEDFEPEVTSQDPVFNGHILNQLLDCLSILRERANLAVEPDIIQPWAVYCYGRGSWAKNASFRFTCPVCPIIFTLKLNYWEPFVCKGGYPQGLWRPLRVQDVKEIRVRRKAPGEKPEEECFEWAWGEVE